MQSPRLSASLPWSLIRPYVDYASELWSLLSHRAPSFREFGAIRLLVDNLGTSDRDLQERVCIAIENLTTDNPANQHMIINCGAAGKPICLPICY